MAKRKYQSIRRHGPCVEFNRLAVQPNNRGKTTFRPMLPFLFSYSRDLGARFGFSSVVEKNKHYNIGFHVPPKYHDLNTMTMRITTAS